MKFYILSLLALCSSAAYSQTLFTYGNSEVSRDEFLRAYNKNKPVVTDKNKALRDYLDLYINFKLKVKAAQELRLDTVSQIRYDVQNFREQVVENYMGDEKAIDQLVNEAAERATKNVHVLIFSVPVAANATPADTLKAAAAAAAVYKLLQSTASGYSDLAATVSASYSPVKFNDAGYVSAFSLPYAYENIIYNTAPGNVSAPYRASKGWYIFKVVDQRPDAGKWRVAQILFAYPPNADLNTRLAVKAKADSVYNLLNNGLAFGSAAKVYSDDRITFQTNGELPEFTTGKYDPAFESKVFMLTDINSITKPFETPYGYHIVKLLAHTNTAADKKDAAFRFDIRQKVQQDARMNTLREKFAKDIIVKTGFKRSVVSDAELFRYADSLMKDPTIENTNAQPISKKTLAVFRDGSLVKGDEWLKYVRDIRSNPEEQLKTTNKNLWDRFISQSALNYYKGHLEEYNTDFKYQMQEFKEGNMLFEIMERNVWGKAGQDTAAIRQYYNAHKNSYRWNASADVMIFNCSNERVAAKVIEGLNAGKSATAIAGSDNTEIEADSGRYELGQINDKPLPGGVTLPFNSGIIKNTDGTASVIQYYKLYPAGEQRSFEESRGLVINDYQNVLESQWIADLKKKYPVTVNDAVFKGL